MLGQKNRLCIRRVAILGSGVMGAQIAAHFANAHIPAFLFDLPNPEGDTSARARKAIQGLEKLQPAPFSSKTHQAGVLPANYQDDMGLLAQCDIVIEAISENMAIKKELYGRVAPHLHKNALFVSNTSGLSINELAQVLPADKRERFCGVHFFNPPRYMSLVELIPHSTASPAMMDGLEEFFTKTLGKTVVRAKDTPSFIANRIGVFSLLAVMHHTAKCQLDFDTVDSLTGTLIGRAKSGTFRSLDVVGLDTLSHVVNSMNSTLTKDPWHSLFQVPSYVANLIQQGHLGQKTGTGIYKKVGKEIQVLDAKTQSYRPTNNTPNELITQLWKTSQPQDRFEKLRNADSPQGQFLWSIFRDLFHYSAYHLEHVAENARDLDMAVRAGFGWAQGPFEIWQEAGWAATAQAIQKDIDKGLTICKAPLPQWVFDKGRTGVHMAQGSYAPAKKEYQTPSKLPVYQRQLFPETVIGETPRARGTTLYENPGVRLWTLDQEVAILSFKTKMNSVTMDVLDGIVESVSFAEKNCQGLVLWQEKAPFSVGANLSEALGALQSGHIEHVQQMIKKFQKASMALKYSLVPTVAAVHGMALGGGCEFIMHCSKAVAALESYIGLVEVGVGLLPAGGGCKEFVLRAAQEAKGGAAFPFLQRYFETVAMAKTAQSAHEAKELGYLRPNDTIVFHAKEVLFVAIQEAKALFEGAYRPPLRDAPVPVTGRGGSATLKAGLINMKEGGFISAHDYEIGSRIALIFGGGDVDQGSLVTEEWLLDLEYRYFMELIKTTPSQERIQFMLKNGKPLRN